MANTPRFQEKYQTEVVPALRKEFGYGNIMQVPALHKVVINIGMGEAIQNPNDRETAKSRRS